MYLFRLLILDLLHLLIYYEVSLRIREEVKQKFVNFVRSVVVLQKNYSLD